jgi:hypothetical protein
LLNDLLQHRNSLLRELNTRDDLGFMAFVRMTKSDFDVSVQKIGPRIRRNDTNHSDAIPATIRLAVTLIYLASGHSFTSPMYTFKISNQSISVTVPEVCEGFIAAFKRVNYGKKNIYCIPELNHACRNLLN